jgi:uncharacterized protein
MKRALLILFLAVPVATARNPFTAPWEKTEYEQLQASSLYVPMRDGVRIAVDVLLPMPLRAGQKVPALFKISRFGRAPADGAITDEDRFWVGHGFARVLIDERGTGASFGASRYGTETIPDLYDIVDWVVKQPWSNGRVGAIGISVEGTAAELLAATNHPAVKAVAPWFSDYNYYTDLVRPGGIFDEWILKHFEDFTLRMDAGDSAKPVDADPGRSLLQQAIAEHRNNLNIYSATWAAPFIDDPIGSAGKTLLDISIPGTRVSLQKSRVPMLVLASWYDAGTVQGTIQRFQEFENLQSVFVGAWSHGAGFNADPFLPVSPVQPGREQLWREALHFFDGYLKNAPIAARQYPRPGARVFSYYTIGKNQWQSTRIWPPRGMRKIAYQLNPDGKLTDRNSGGARRTRFQPALTGEHNRWQTQLGGGPVDYRSALERMSALTLYSTVPLAAPMEITGQAALRLRIICSQQEDPSIVAYLVAIDPQGGKFYLTEGQLRLLHRKLDPSAQTRHSYLRRDAQPVLTDEEMQVELTLLPTSVFLRKGTRIQLWLASGDDSTFPSSGAYNVAISAASRLELPVR